MNITENLENETEAVRSDMCYPHDGLSLRSRTTLSRFNLLKRHYSAWQTVSISWPRGKTSREHSLAMAEQLILKGTLEGHVS